MSSSVPTTIRIYMSSNKNGFSRKRGYSDDSEEDADYTVEMPVKQQKLDKSNGDVNGLGKQVKVRLKSFLDWMSDVSSRNYFVKSAMQALGLSIEDSARSNIFSSETSEMNTKCSDNTDKDDSVFLIKNSLKSRKLARSPIRNSMKDNFITLREHQIHNIPKIIRSEKVSQKKFNGWKEDPSGNLPVEPGPSGYKKGGGNPFKLSRNLYGANPKSTKKYSINQTKATKKEDLNTMLGTPVSTSTPNTMTGFLGNIKSKKPFQLVGNLNIRNYVPHSSMGILPKESVHRKGILTAKEEREQYRMLIQRYTNESLYHPVARKAPTLKDAESQVNIASETSSSSERVLRPAFSREKLDYPLKFPAQYIKPCQLVKPQKSFMKVTTISSVENSKQAPQTKDFEDDDVIITDIKPPALKSLPNRMKSSAFFSPQWITELKKTVDEEKEERKRIIQDQEKQIKEYRELRAARYAAADEKTRERLRLSGAVLPESLDISEEEDLSLDFPKLTPEMEDLIEDALKPDPPEEILSDGFRLSVTRKDMETLSGLNWLNDEIINFYMNLIMERSKLDNYPSAYAFNTFFYPKLISGGQVALKRWTRKLDIFSYDLILVPVHMGMHWCLAVIDFRQKKIQYYDSMGGQNTECLNALSSYLRDESLDKKKQEYDLSGWTLETVKNIPQQMNGSDCGMFALKYAEYITRDSKITFTQENMQYFRRRMVYEILKQQLL